MNNKAFKLTIVILSLACASLAHAATIWSTQDYDLYSGDFNGDGKTDILYIAKDSAKPSGIAISDGNGPNVSLQSWPSNYLGIQWYGGLYVAVVGDFNHDGKGDVLLQRTSPGDSYLLLADGNGRLTGISQTISSGALGLSWSKDQHVILAGDFNGDGRADLFFQAVTPSGTNAVVLADVNGTFTTGPSQTWTDSSWSAFRWSTRNSVISLGNFNGDGQADLLIQAKPDIVLIDFDDMAIPIPVYRPGSFGIAYSPLGSNNYMLWDRMRAGVDWSTTNSNLIIGDFNGDGRFDVIVQSKRIGGITRVVWGNAATNQLDLDHPTTLTFSGAGNATGDVYRILAANVAGYSSTGVYLQAMTPGGTDLIASTIPTAGGEAATTTLNHAIETISYSYDAKGRLTRVVHSGTVNSIVQTQYTYDKANNRKTLVTTGSAN